MAGSAAERPPSADDDSQSDWTDAARRAWRRLLVFVAHWRLRTRSVCRLVAGSIRSGVQYYLRGGGGRSASGPGRSRDPLLPAIADFDALPVARDEADVESGPRSLPSSRDTRRGLPAGRGTLEVERTRDRLTISDPATEEAYLSSTVWVEVEE